MFLRENMMWLLKSRRKKDFLAGEDFSEISETTTKLIVGETGGEDFLVDKRKREEEEEKRAILSIQNGEKVTLGLCERL